MHRTRIKICGITRPEDAAAAAAAGADAIGMVFYPKAARYIPIDRAKEIFKRNGASDVSTVGEEKAPGGPVAWRQTPTVPVSGSSPTLRR